MCHEVFELHSDPHPGNFLVTPNGEVVFLDFGSVKTLDPVYMDGLLRIVKACMDSDYNRVRELMTELKFGGKKLDPMTLPIDQLRRYHELVL